MSHKIISIPILVRGAGFNRSEGIAKVIARAINAGLNQGYEFIIYADADAIQATRETIEEISGGRAGVVYKTNSDWFRLNNKFLRICIFVVRQRDRVNGLRTKLCNLHSIKKVLLAMARRQMGLKGLVILLATPLVYVLALIYSILVLLAEKGMGLVHRQENKYFSKIAKRIDSDRSEVMWLINPTWRVGEFIKRKKKVSFVWDLHYLDFPFGFKSYETHPLIEKNCEGSRKIVAMSKYVLNNHVSQISTVKDAEKSFLVPPIIDLPAIESKQGAYAVIKNYLERVYSSYYAYDRYLVDLPVEKLKIVIIPTSIRPYKNILNVIRAAEILIRRKRRNLKFVFTGNFLPDQQEYLKNNGLTLDCLSIQHLPEDVLSAFVKISECVVVSSFVEGGLPLNFGTAVHLGTPTALAKMPTVMEYAERMSFKETLFEPSDVEQMVKAIEFCLDHRDQVNQQQKQFIAEVYDKNTWSQYFQNIVEQ